MNVAYCWAFFNPAPQGLRDLAITGLSVAMI
jgi:high-affinity nickel permease